MNKFSLIAIQKQIEGEGKSGWKGFFGGEVRTVGTGSMFSDRNDVTTLG